MKNRSFSLNDLLGSDLPLQSCKKNKQLVEGADYAHFDA
jgi:hypothetical protein